MLATVSPEDFEHLSRFRWHAQLSKAPGQAVGNWYAYRMVELPKVDGKRKRKKIYMHREVLERAGHDMSGMYGDHKHSDTLDNRRCQLRPATPKQNFAYSCGTDNVEW